ncbi:MAG: division/cell wall cluster transcriptional repressor MraZ [Anaerovoracaceae bacterium]
MFIGSYENSIDTKSRMIIPAKYRDGLGGSCVMTKGIDQCIYIYPIEEWNAFAKKLEQLPKADFKARNFVRHFYGNAEECTIDSQGRVTIPASLRTYGRIEKELTTMGNGEKIEVWSREVYEENAEILKLDGADIAEGMEHYGI